MRYLGPGTRRFGRSRRTVVQFRLQRAGVRDRQHADCDPGNLVSRRGARLRDAVRLRAARARARARTGDAGTAGTCAGHSGADCSAAPAPPSSGDTAISTQQRGRISMYGNEFAGRKTASGEPFDPAALTMAHRTLPFGTRVRVTNLENQRSVEVVVNDRGPFVAGRIADLSEAAARRIGMIADGVVEALLDILQTGEKALGKL